MQLPHLTRGTLVQRYKRFLADVLLDDGTAVTAHCANPGAMTGLADPGAHIWLSRSSAPGRKLPWSWELVEAHGQMIGVNTGRANAVIGEALAEGSLPDLTGYEHIRREVAYGERSRVDFLLEAAGRPPCYLEVKSVTLFRQPGLAEFPDARTARGARHLDELTAVVASGCRAVTLYLVQGRAASVALAADIDPAYARAAETAQQAGVEMLAVEAAVSPVAIVTGAMIPVRI